MLWVLIMGVICFCSGFSVRGTMDQALIRKLQDTNSECVGILKGFVLGRSGRVIRDNNVDSNIHRI